MKDQDQQFVLTVMTRTKAKLKSQPETMLGTPNDAVVLIQRGGQQSARGGRTQVREVKLVVGRTAVESG